MAIGRPQNVEQNSRKGTPKCRMSLAAMTNAHARDECHVGEGRISTCFETFKNRL